jgi:hypothetical protein
MGTLGSPPHFKISTLPWYHFNGFFKLHNSKNNIMKAQNTIFLFQVSEIQLNYYPKFEASERLKVTFSKNAYEIFYENWNCGKLQLCEQYIA